MQATAVGWISRPFQIDNKKAAPWFLCQFGAAYGCSVAYWGRGWEGKKVKGKREKGKGMEGGSLRSWSENVRGKVKGNGDGGGVIGCWLFVAG